jgi:DNA-binding NarL/FixJ family response regulator
MTASSSTRILIADDNDFHRKGVRLYLLQKGFDVLEAPDAATAWQIVLENSLHAVILDIVLPSNPGGRPEASQSVGVDLARQIKRVFPSLAIVLFSAHEDRGRAVADLMRDGARGIVYKLKGCPPAALLSAVEAAQAGQVIIDPDITGPPSLVEELLAHLDPAERHWVEQVVGLLEQLTPREREVVERMAAANNVEGIAQALSITPKTVENHIGRIYCKLGLNEMRRESHDLRCSVVLTKAFLIHNLGAGKGQ